MTEREALTIFRVIQKCRYQALHTNDCGNCERCQYRLEQEQIDGAVAFVISALENNKWIPVTKRPPEKEGCYLVTIKYDHERRYSKTAWYSGDGWITRQDIIAWRMTPEPYREEEV